MFDVVDAVWEEADTGALDDGVDRVVIAAATIAFLNLDFGRSSERSAHDPVAPLIKRLGL